MSKARVLLVATGGTITMTPGAGPGIVPALRGEDLVAAVPQLAQHADLEVVTYSQKPGASLTLQDLNAIAALADERLTQGCAGVIVVQGTDTIEETAFALDCLVRSDRPVVVTGAMRGPTAPGADGPANLLASVIVASSEAMAGMGTVVVLNDEVHAARYVQKGHTASTAAFASPGFGPLARVIESGVRVHARVQRRIRLAPSTQPADIPVALVGSFLGDDGRLLAALPSLGFRGAVIEAMGGGHLPATLAPMVESLAREMPVVLATRVASGPVFERTYGFPGSEMDLIAKGAIPAGSLTGPKASLLLRMLLARGLSAEALRQAIRDAGCDAG